MQTHLICYADSNMTISQQLCMKSAQEIGKIDNVYSYNPSSLDRPFYHRYKHILEADQRAGGKGFWLWKPYIVESAIRALPEGDILIYCDSGVEWVNKFDHLYKALSNPQSNCDDILLFGNEHRHVDWCKAEVWAPMLKLTLDAIIRHKQVQASVIIMRVSEYTRELASRWLAWSCIPGFIDDTLRGPQLREFSAHRNDQSILTNLAIEDGVQLHWWPAQYGHHIKRQYIDDWYPQMFYHHRRRNDEWATEMQKHGLTKDQAIQRFMNQPKHV